MFRFEKSISINRPPSEVFAFIANPSKTRQWRYDVLETKFDSLPLHVGDHLQEIVDFNGPQTCNVEVISMVPNEKLVFKVTSGTTYRPLRELTFSEEDGHTRFTIRVSAYSDNFSRFIEPLSANMYSLKWDSYLFKLKKALEE